MDRPELERKLRSALEAEHPLEPVTPDAWRSTRARFDRGMWHEARFPVLAAVTVLLAAAIAIPVRSGSGGGPVAAADIVTRVTSTAEAKGSYKWLMTQETKFSGGSGGMSFGFSYTMRFEGVRDLRQKTGRTTMSMSIGEGSGAEFLRSISPVPCELVEAGGTTYFRVPDDLKRQFGGKAWVSSPTPLSAGLSVGAGGIRPDADPADLIQQLGGAEQLTPDGKETVRGVETTRYKGAADVATIIEQVPPETRQQLQQSFEQAGLIDFPVVVWIDREDLVRRMRIEYRPDPAAETGQFSFSSITTAEYFDFGAPADIAVPPAADVKATSNPSEAIGACVRTPQGGPGPGGPNQSGGTIRFGPR